MSATFRIISHRVGEGGLKVGRDVRRIQQLLFLNGHRIKCDGVWHHETRDALLQFQTDASASTNALFLCAGLLPSTDCALSARPYVIPDESLLLHMALGAGVLIPLAHGHNGADAFQKVHMFCEDLSVGFDMSPSRAVWGLAGCPAWAIVTANDGFDTSEPRDLNCTLYANLMMSVWRRGNAHSAPFSANVSASGGDQHLAVNRYGFPLVGKFNAAGDIRKIAHQHPGRLFCLEAGDQVGHMALLLHNRVYECNIWPQIGCFDSPLDDFCNRHYTVWVSGPSPN